MNKFMNIKRKYVIWGIIILLISLGVYYFFIKEKSVLATKIDIETTTVEKSVSANGQVSSLNHAELSFGTTGRVLSINVTKDQKVQKGALLGQIDSASAYQTLQALDDTVDIAKREKDEFIIEYSNGEKRDDYGQRKYVETIRKLDEIIHQAESSYKAQLSSLSNTAIRAPFSGTIIDVTKDASESSALGERVFTIVDTDNMYFEADLEQEDFGFIREGQSVEVSLDSYEEQEKFFKGTVTTIPQFINSDNSILIKISIEPSDVPVLYGMNGEARIIIDNKENVSAVTFDQVFTDDNGDNFVWIIEKENGTDRLKKKPIEVGLEGDVYTEILTDLNGYTVVIPATNDIEFKEGLKVSVENAQWANPYFKSKM